MYANLTIGQVLRHKGTGFWGIGPEATAFDALALMAEKNIGVLLVMEGEHLAGIFSERDYARKVILQGRSSKTTTVGALMSSPPVTCGPELSVRDGMALMTGNNFRHLPVVEEGRVQGIVTVNDVVKAIISAQDEEIHQLEALLSG